jgi:hypothetical protein
VCTHFTSAATTARAGCARRGGDQKALGDAVFDGIAPDQFSVARPVCTRTNASAGSFARGRPFRAARVEFGRRQEADSTETDEHDPGTRLN